ncbi:similar to An03g02800 [Aspergillus luchuensis]|uniref:Similar to An03g02800 n=1 Tax=Aspergillus kawachii TaxID=1069201 RepID=A0A146FDF8_ASPKA|nr:similar to An03g02800 [Aspergillus luchuensis]
MAELPFGTDFLPGVPLRPSQMVPRAASHRSPPTSRSVVQVSCILVGHLSLGCLPLDPSSISIPIHHHHHHQPPPPRPQTQTIGDAMGTLVRSLFLETPRPRVSI